MISDTDLFVNRFISVPKDMGQLNCAAFVAGIVRGALDGAGFPARQVVPAVCAHKSCCVAAEIYGCLQGDSPLCGRQGCPPENDNTHEI